MASPVSVVVIPARLKSSRLPRKLLLNETGKTILQHTFEAASRAKRPREVFIAADSDEIAKAAHEFGVTAVMTDPEAPSGTDRVAEVARKLHDVEIVINVQGDEPEIEPTAIDLVAKLLEDNPAAAMSTLATPIRSRRMLEDPSCVKVVVDNHGRALYFSRSPIPYVRDDQERGKSTLIDSGSFLLHIGMYAYRREFLLQYPKLPPSPLECLERLEQLRALQTGLPILVGIVEESASGIDTPEDYAAFVKRQVG